MMMLMAMLAQQEVMEENSILPQNHKLTKRCVKVGTRMTEVAEMDFPGGSEWEFFVIDSAQQNAFVLPNGKVYVHRGLMELLDKEGELEVILGHEIAHVQAGHSAERASLMRFPNVVRSMYMLLVWWGVPILMDPGLWQVSLGGRLLFELPFSRLHEDEADAIGVNNLVRACIDPRTALRVWRKMDSGDSVVPTFMSTHPSAPQRLQKMQAMMDAQIGLYASHCTVEKQKVRQMLRQAAKAKRGEGASSWW
eukprot:TRINITY_DN26391_c0_g1_i2.p1 TRINITY_DN26391_c0_g1~~TRINITY_DN26391_c0_g1_i2.p1  ORF type:complete len:251 (-),score=45.31 TRINITY_DN26391_c0_g1_i2:124-876(-)